MTEGCTIYVGDRGTSFGPFQLHFAYPGHQPALGNKFMAETGLDPRDPRTWPEQIDWSMRYAKLHGWSHDWFGYQQAAWRGRARRWDAVWRGRRHHHRHWAEADYDFVHVAATAIYDIAAHTVFMPDGSKLDVHSGLGPAHDNPRAVAERRRGPTPPGLYALRPRGRFYGDYAFALVPVAANTYGRSGLLTHSCLMRGRQCQSFGCMSFEHYAPFRDAVERGSVRRVRVVAGI